MTDGITIKGAGILFVTEGGKALFLKRGPGGDYPGLWCFPGGTTEGSETPEETAKREALEEVGSLPTGKRTVHTRTITPRSPMIAEPGAIGGDRVDFTTFLQIVKEPFEPTVNGEHVGFAWAPVGEPPEPLHPGCRIALSRLTMDELGVARAMVTGELTSPQRYGNVSLFDMRITGTGVAYRGEKRDEQGNIVQNEEFVYRRPENYLTEDFLARCNGLQVIMLHPKTSILDSKEFAARTVGAMMLPYIKGAEVWGIAKVYDDDTIAMLEERQMSTSPAVLLGDGNHKLKLEDGSDLLIEGKPSLLDHLAICEQGVWDKGGEPSGVRNDTTGETEMPMTKEDKDAIAALIAESVSAIIPNAVSAAIAKARADSGDAGTMPDKLLSAIDGFGKRMDEFGKRMDSHGQRMDAEEKKKADADEEGKRADAVKFFSARKDGESDDDYKKRHDAEEETCRKDAMSGGTEEAVASDRAKKARKDAEEAEGKEAEKKADKKKADGEEKAKADAAAALAAAAANPELAGRIANLERLMPKALTDSDRHNFAIAQARADEVYSGFGKSAPYPLQGEDVGAYRRRLAAGLKEHSVGWQKVDVIAIADDATFTIAEEAILKDAAIAALHPADLKDDELREVTRVDRATGVRTTEFRGKHSFIAGMTRPPRFVTRIGQRKEA